MSKKEFYTIEEFEKFAKHGLELKYVLQPKWYGFNQHTIENIDFILGVLNKTGDTPYQQKIVYLMRITEEMNTLYDMLFTVGKLPYVMTEEQIKERINKLSDGLTKIYYHK